MMLPELDIREVDRFLWFHVRQVMLLEVVIILIHIRGVPWVRRRFLRVLLTELLLKHFFHDLFNVLLLIGSSLWTQGASSTALCRPLKVVMLMLLELDLEATDVMLMM